MERNLGIDALRAGAALLVFLFHLPDGLLGYRIGSGWVGITLFFVLSGYLITGKLLELSDDRLSFGEALRSFYIRRVFRILPLYIAFLAVVTVAGIALDYGPVEERLVHA